MVLDELFARQREGGRLPLDVLLRVSWKGKRELKVCETELFHSADRTEK